MRHLVAIALVCAATAVRARAQPAEPTGAHPRMLLDGELRAAWREQAKQPHGPVIGAIKLCADAHATAEHDHAVYQGQEWAKVMQACLVAWAATDDDDAAKTAIRFMTALLDDRDLVGDGSGGDTSAQRDDGYAIRNLGPYTALAYDWLHDKLTPQQREHARARWKAWLAWYRAHGYRATTPGSNYHAGYLLTATMVAIAEAGEAGADGTALWREVADTMWGKDMAIALSDGGVLAGGDWPEGWQYGPLAVAEIALGARIMRGAGAGAAVAGAAGWLHALFRRHVYALTPGDRVLAGGDTEAEQANLGVNVLTLDAVALGDASPDDKRWARGELSRLGLADRDELLYDALAGVGDKPVLVPRASWPTWYLAGGTGTLFARTRWDDRAIWFATNCHAAIDVDHRHPDAGNFVLVRGKDEVIVDPSPYGSQSTFTSNAPTVRSAHLPGDYQPSQGFWSEKTGFDFATQRQSGVVAARCDYSDQFKFQDRRSDVPAALRDLVLVPNADGTAAALVVIDRAETGGEDRAMYVGFRTPGKLALAGDVATATIGETMLTIAGVKRSGGKPALGGPTQKDCFKAGTVRGTCDAARIPVTDYRVEVPGEQASAVHVIGAVGTGGPAVTAAPIGGDGWAGVAIGGVRDATIAWGVGGKAPSALATKPGLVVLLDAPSGADQVRVTGKPGTGGACELEIAPGGDVPARPAIVTVDAKCQVAADPETSAQSARALRTDRAAAPGGTRTMRSGCCGAQTTPASPIAVGAVVLPLILRRRRRRRQR